MACRIQSETVSRKLKPGLNPLNRELAQVFLSEISGNGHPKGSTSILQKSMALLLGQLSEIGLSRTSAATDVNQDVAERLSRVRVGAHTHTHRSSSHESSTHSI